MLAEKAKPKLPQPKAATPPGNWKIVLSTSDKLYSYFARSPALDQGIKIFVSEKLKKMRDAEENGVVTPKTLFLGSADRGRFHDPKISHMDHYHVNVAGGKLYVLVYWQQIDPASKTLSLKLVSFVDHKQYESKPMQKSLGKALGNASYTPVGVIESKPPLFGWLGPRPHRVLFDWLKGNE